MKYFLYKNASGKPDVTQYELQLDLFAGYRLISVHDERPAIEGMIFDAHDKLVRDPDAPPEYISKRRAAYPRITDQLDMLWHAMERGEMARIEPFYSEILAVKQAYPKTSN
ncbi:MAG: hypothetical protein WC997_02470 [Porticoccaceae bacterium]